ncbi:MAG: spermidine synthase [Terriglobales bacterium]
MATVGLPYFSLATTNPLIQSWFSDAMGGATPYRLFAISNAGSLLGLFSYPLVVEPLLSLRHQVQIWSAAYLLFCLLWVPLIFLRITRLGGKKASFVIEVKGPLVARAIWVALAACSSALLCAVTNHLTQDVAPIPMLCIVPLGVYLFSFILCFRKQLQVSRRWLLELLIVALVAMAYGLTSRFENESLSILLPIYIIGLFICCVFCHAELARRKPVPAQLTSFYLMIALGGLLGGVFVGVVAPLLFNSHLELPITIGFVSVVGICALRDDAADVSHRARWRLRWVAITLLAIGFNVILIFIVWQNLSGAKVLARNFYGCLRVVDQRVRPSSDIGKRGNTASYDATRKLQNGSIDHGIQFLSSELRRVPTSYYGVNSGIGVALRSLGRHGSLRVGVVGLGAGTLAAYGRPGDFYRFYEINPLVANLAKSEFTFLSDSEAKVEIVLGDARLVLEKQAPQAFDLLAIDAFSGDAIPLHLLTREAFSLYRSHLKSRGILAVHISNIYLDLQSVVFGTTDSMDLRSVLIHDKDDPQNHIYASDWILITDNQDSFDDPAIQKAVAQKLNPKRLVWTDDFSNLLRVLN